MLTRTAKRYVIASSIVVFLIALYTVVGFWAVPHFLRSGVTDFVGSHYKRQVALGDIRFNPYTFTLDISDFTLPDSDGKPMLGFGHLHVDLEVVSLFRLGPSFREIVLERPLVRAVVRPNGALNLADLGQGFAPSPKPAAPPPKQSEPMRLFIDHFAVLAGGATFEDLSHATPFHAEFKPIAFELHNFSTRAKPGTTDGNEYTLTAASPEGERLEWNGSFLLEPLSAHGTFAVTDLHAGTIWSYLQDPLPLEIPSGTIAVKGEYNFDNAGQAPSIKVNVHDTTVSDLRLRPRQGTTDYVVLGKLEVQETQVDVAKRAVEIGKVSLTGGEVNAWVSAQGKLNLLELAGPASGTPAAASNASGAAAVAPVTGAFGSQASGAPDAAASNTSSGAAVAPAASTSGSQAGGADASVASAATQGANAPGPGGSDASGATATARSNAPGTTATGTAFATAGPNTPGANSPGAPATATASAAAPVWTVSVPDISVNGFKVSAEDRQVTPALALTLSPIDIHVAGYNTTPAARLDITAKTTVNGSSTLSATAQLSPSGAGDTTAHIDLAQFDLAMFQPFIAQRTAMTLQSGKLTTQLDIKKTADGVLSAKGDVDLTGVKSVDELQQSFIRWKDLRVAGIQYNSQPASLQIATVTAQGAYARIIIAPDRTVNVVQVLAGPSKGTPGVATQLGAASAKAGGVSVAGVTGGAPGQAAALHADVKAAKKDAKEEAKEAKAGVANATAPGAPAPGAAKPGATAAEAAAPEANVSGSAAPGATASGAAAPEGNVSGSAAPGVTASGAAAPQANAPVAANSGGTSPQAPASPPAAAQGAAPDTAATAAAKSGKHRGRKSGSNAPGGTAVASTQSSAPAMPMSIDTIRIMDGSVNYADFWIQPNFAVGIQMLNGTIEGLSSDPKSRAKVKLEGKVDRYAPVTINGEMNVLAAAVYTDIDMSFKGLELTTMTPYSGHFAGYKIDKGKLSVDLSYKIDQRKLNAEQHFVIDQLQLGDAVDSPDAVHLPLKLAVALLKDRNGVIDLPLPITGSLDDPQFKVGPIIWHAVVNLLEKAVTAPFAAIGHLFGGHGEELKYVDFTAGSADLDDASKQKLDALTKALEEHDQLQLDVPLVYSQDLDAPVLAKRTLTLRLIARAHGGKLPPAVQQALASQQNAGQNPPPGQGAAAGQHASAGQGATGQNAPSGQAAAGNQQAGAGQGASGQNAPSGQQVVGNQPAGVGQGAPGQNAPVAQQVATSQPAPAGQHTPAAPAPAAPAAPPLPTDPALTDPLQHYRLLLAEYQAELGKDTGLPASAAAIQNAKSKKDTPPVESAIPDLENALIGQIDVPDLQLQDLAKRRTRAIQDALLADGGINAARVFIINGTAKTDDNGKVRVEMALK